MEIRGRQLDEWGRVVFDEDGLVDLLMSGKELTKDLSALDSRGVSRYNQLCRELDHPEDQVSSYEPLDVTAEQWDEAHQSIWFTEEPYASLDVESWLLARCSSNQEEQRIREECELFRERNMEQVLRCLIGLVDSFRQRGIVWGVGRGSSVASFALFLIGVHKVNSMAFDLDIREFLK